MAQNCTNSCQDTNCATCPLDTCTVCNSGYSIWGGTCIACTVSNCGTCNTSSQYVCTTCKDGYWFSLENTCTVCATGCLTCESITGICTECDTVFFFLFKGNRQMDIIWGMI